MIVQTVTAKGFHTELVKADIVGVVTLQKACEHTERRLLLHAVRYQQSGRKVESVVRKDAFIITDESVFRLSIIHEQVFFCL